MSGLRAYLDDSGTSAGARYTAVAGWLGTEEEWARFRVRWQRELDRSPRVNGLHMREVFGKGPWQAFLPRIRQDKIKALARIIMEGDLTPISVMVMVEAVNQANLVPASEAEDLASMIAARNAVEYSASLAFERGWKEGLEICFDNPSDSRKEARMHRIACYAAIHMRRGNWRRCQIADITFSSDEVETPLQAADLHVWHQTRFKSFSNSSLEAPRIARPYDILLGKAPIPNQVDMFPDMIRQRGIPGESMQCHWLTSARPRP